MDHGMNDDSDLRQLAVLDPARDREPSPAEWARSRARLEESMASRTATRPSARSQARTRRLALGVIAASVLAAGVVVAVPSVLPGGGNAYASWTAVPQAPTDSQSRAAAKACAKGWNDGSDHPLSAGDVVLAERRGEATLLIMWLAGGPLIECSLLEPGEPGGAQMLAERPGGEPPLPPAGHVTIDTMSSMGQGRTQYSSVIGRVGANVTSVEITLPDGERIRTSVAAGWWTAWWPGPAGGEVDTIRIVVHTAAGTKTYKQEELY